MEGFFLYDHFPRLHIFSDHPTLLVCNSLPPPLSTGGVCKVELLEALDAKVEFPEHFAEWDVGTCDAVYFLIQKE